MIRRVVEYIVVCDGPNCPCGSGSCAYGSRTKAECEEAARQDGWVQVSKRKWYCQTCAMRRHKKET